MTDYQELPAPPPLDRWIRCIWFLRGPSDGAVQTIVPDGRSELVIHLADPFAQVGEDGCERTQSRLLVAGQLRGPLRLVPGGYADVVGIRFRTAAARAVLGVPHHELTDTIVPLGDLLPQREGALLDAAATSGSCRQRALAIIRVLASGVLRPLDPVAVAAAQALDQVTPPRIGTLAQQLRVSPRGLERRVRDATGLTPIDLRSVLRFRRAFAALGTARPGQWGSVAYAAGYFDQAHLIRDFRRFSGTTPSQFFGGGDQLSQLLLGDA